MDARWRTWTRLAHAWEMQPLTPEIIEKVASSLQAGGYKSAKQYFSRAKREHMRTQGTQALQEVEQEIRDACRSIARRLGGPELKDAFSFESLALSECEPGRAHALVVTGAWFLMREIELAALRVQHVTLDEEQLLFTLTLWASKTDIEGNLAQRTHRCCCRALGSLHCSFHVLARYMAKERESRRRTSSKPPRAR